MYSVQCTVYSKQCTVYSVQCTVYSVKCTVYSVQCEVYSVQCKVYSVQCKVYSVQCTLYSVHIPKQGSVIYSEGLLDTRSLILTQDMYLLSQLMSKENNSPQASKFEGITTWGKGSMRI